MEATMIRILTAAQTTPIQQALRNLLAVFKDEKLLGENTLMELVEKVAVAIGSGGDLAGAYSNLWEFCAAIGHTQRGELNKALREFGKVVSSKACICVVVRGGLVQSVMSSTPEMDVTVRDFDNIQAGDEDPLAAHVGENDYTDYDAAGYPFEVW